MKYAIINDQRAEPSKGAKGVCPACGAEMIAKCGKIKVSHWAHKSKRKCDPWWENETAWHREWKNYFNPEWQESVHKDVNTGEIHIADVTTPYGWTIEIQHSPMDDEERKARNTFYKKIVWIVDGTRRKTDIAQLNHLLKCGVKLRTKNQIFAINPDNKNRLLTEWRNNESLVFFDFKQALKNGQRIIWFVLPKFESKDTAFPEFANYLFIQPFSTSLFIDAHITGAFDQFFTHEIHEHLLVYCKELYNIRRRYNIGVFPDPTFSWLAAN